MRDAGPERWSRSRIAALAGGPALGLVGWAWCEPSLGGAGALSPAGAATVGMLVWMAVWWATQAVDLAITGLLPVVVFPLAGIAPTEQVLPPYANDVIFLFAGGCVMAFAIERHGLGERFTSMVLSRIGHAPQRVVAGFMVTTALVSAWVSNTAATAMMLPLAMAAIAWFAGAQGVADGVDGSGRRPMQQFQQAVLLAVAYGASIGGAMTILGSPPNPIAAEWIRESGGEMSFARWASFGVPLGVAMMAGALVAFRFLFPCRGLRAPVQDATAFANRAPMTRAAWITLAVFACAATAWVAAPLVAPWTGLRLRDGQIAVAAAIVLLAVPEGRGQAKAIVPWSDIGRLPLGVFLLFGGGLALADAMQRTGVSDAIAASLTGLSAMPEPLLILLVVLVMVFASEIASNTALAATAVPIVGAMAAGLGVPSERLVIAAALGASYAFMLPVGTPPNAIVYATGCVPVRSMLRAGLVLNIIAAAIVTAVCLLIV
ncbi:MAG: SLC13/DASS family transporter [Phycisphaerales bacterium]|nr:SLC13/DASS family transporter [Phycisphaerales bacterium]